MSGDSKKLMQKISCSQAGFSIVEAVMVLALVAILSYVAVSELSKSSASIKEKTLAQKILSDVRYAQEMALNHRREVRFQVEPSNNRYSIKWGDGTYLKTALGEQNFSYNISTSDFKGTMISSSGFSAGLLSFNSKGQPYNNGTALTSETTLICLNNSVHIKIVPGTGSCYIQE